MHSAFQVGHIPMSVLDLCVGMDKSSTKQEKSTPLSLLGSISCHDFFASSLFAACILVSLFVLSCSMVGNGNNLENRGIG